MAGRACREDDGAAIGPTVGRCHALRGIGPAIRKGSPRWFVPSPRPRGRPLEMLSPSRGSREREARRPSGGPLVMLARHRLSRPMPVTGWLPLGRALAGPQRARRSPAGRPLRVPLTSSTPRVRSPSRTCSARGCRCPSRGHRAVGRRGGHAGGGLDEPTGGCGTPA